MPYGALDRPGLGISLLKSWLLKLNIFCDVRYFTFAFAEFIGREEYQWISSGLPHTAFTGEWTFTSGLYGERPAIDHQYVQEILRDQWLIDDTALNRILRIRSFVPYFLDFCMATVPWQEYALIGFTSTFEQNLASLALAKRIKAQYPKIQIVFGGANWEEKMGLELHRNYEFVDFVCSGEAERSFPLLVQHLLSKKTFDGIFAEIPGIVYRTNGRSISTGPAETINQMDEQPFCDFNDYFSNLKQSTVAASVVPILLLETSRGCWWGQKSHCTFCGLNGRNMTFRSKSSERVLEELQFLTHLWQIDFIEVVDNILDMKYFDDLLPALANSENPVRLFFEVKANLKRKHIETLKSAGVYRIQPGIESMSDHILKLMRKGTTTLKNIQLLKWCYEYDILVDWNILYGFPGEKQEDYEDMLNLLPPIRFMNPPNACGPVRLDRFSPYYEAAEDFGLTNVRPISPYRYLYNVSEKSLSKIAYYFDYDYEPGNDPTGFAQKISEYVQFWRINPEKGKLCSVSRADGTLALLDTRSDAIQPEVILAGMEQAAYEYCDELRSLLSVTRYLHHCFPVEEFTQQQVLAFLDSLVWNKLMVTDGKRYLSLAIPVRPVTKN
jgi:ribosomal peptide maturation radical SAM protein 1